MRRRLGVAALVGAAILLWALDPVEAHSGRADPVEQVGLLLMLAGPVVVFAAWLDTLAVRWLRAMGTLVLGVAWAWLVAVLWASSYWSGDLDCGNDASCATDNVSRVIGITASIGIWLVGTSIPSKGDQES